jgi:hypothetical protein
MDAEVKLERFLRSNRVDPEEIDTLHLPGNRVHREVRAASCFLFVLPIKVKET